MLFPLTIAGAKLGSRGKKCERAVNMKRYLLYYDEVQGYAFSLTDLHC